jgi:hypothetical protein
MHAGQPLQDPGGEDAVEEIGGGYYSPPGRLACITLVAPQWIRITDPVSEMAQRIHGHPFVEYVADTQL